MMSRLKCILCPYCNSSSYQLKADGPKSKPMLIHEEECKRRVFKLVLKADFGWEGQVRLVIYLRLLTHLISKINGGHARYRTLCSRNERDIFIININIYDLSSSHQSKCTIYLKQIKKSLKESHLLMIIINLSSILTVGGCS